jgi:peptidoglycan/LPS O-acetylase OafA/YrhL
LDALRGLAALVVLLFHVSLFQLAPETVNLTGNPINDILVFSPLRLLILAREAVHLFFVISGFVLPSFLESTRSKPRRYFSSRFLRLYVPAWCALSFFILVEKATDYLENETSESLEVIAVVKDIVLIYSSGHVLGVLWSLAWEILFSIALFWTVNLVKAGWFWVKFLGLCVTVMIGDLTNIGFLQYMPMFFVGTLMWQNRTLIQSQITSLLGSRVRTYLAIGLVVCILTLPYSLGAIFFDELSQLEAFRIFWYPFELASCSCLLALFAWNRRIVDASSHPFFRGLGRISFSLYLTHQSVLLFFERTAHHWVLAPVLAIGVSLITASVFYRLIEKPIHNAARKVARGT